MISPPPTKLIAYLTYTLWSVISVPVRLFISDFAAGTLHIVKNMNITYFLKSMAFWGPNQLIFVVEASNQAKNPQLVIKLSIKMKNYVARYAYYRWYVYYQL